MKTMKTAYFFGNKISEYGLENGYVDYTTLAKSFDAVLNNDIMSKIGLEYFELVNGNNEYFEFNGNTYTYDKITEIYEELEDELNEINDNETEHIEELEEKLNDLRTIMDDPHYKDIYQYYIISDAGLQILQEYTDEIVYRSEEYDLNIWCVTHYGTGWSYVLTDIKIEAEEE